MKLNKPMWNSTTTGASIAGVTVPGLTYWVLVVIENPTGSELLVSRTFSSATANIAYASVKLNYKFQHHNEFKVVVDAFQRTGIVPNSKDPISAVASNDFIGIIDNEEGNLEVPDNV